MVIEDPDDPRIADYRHLTDAALRQAYEGAEGVLIAEGHLVITQLLRSQYAVRSFLTTPARLPVLEELLDGTDVAPVYVAGPDVMAAVAGFDVHRGLLAAAARRPLPSVDEVVAGAAVVAVLEGINDHENMGAIFRNAAAFSVNAIVLDPRCCDPLYRRSVRVSMGHVLRLPFAVADEWPGALDRVRALGVRVVALTPDPDAPPIDALDPPVALLLGAEGDGLSADALARADQRARIPIADGVDSLNVATAAAVAFYLSSGRRS